MPAIMHKSVENARVGPAKSNEYPEMRGAPPSVPPPRRQYLKMPRAPAMQGPASLIFEPSGPVKPAISRSQGVGEVPFPPPDGCDSQTSEQIVNAEVSESSATRLPSAAPVRMSIP
jgi:hypothetical protein